MNEKQLSLRQHREWMPGQLIAVSFASVIAIGTCLLMLPISTAPGKVTHWMDALFTATSATCVTGLITVDTGTHWSIFGQLVVLLLLQIGGLGLVTFATFFNVLMGKKLGLRSRMLAQESINTSDMSNITRLVRMVVFASLCFECIGALSLSTVFVPKYGAKGLFISIFLSISAFCNGGMDILGFEQEFVSVSNYAGNPVLLGTIALLIITGGLGFFVWSDLYQYRRTKQLSLHSRIVLIGTIALILAGTLGILLLEWGNAGTIGGFSFGKKLLNAGFQSVSARTAGFNSVDIAALHGGSKILLCILMVIGACPGSTGGGIKITTFTVVAMTVWCVIRGDQNTMILGRRVGRHTVYKSLAILVVSLLIVAAGAGLMTELLGYAGVPAAGVDVFFEACSAFGTVGLSAGVTGVATMPVKWILIMMMYLGRVGPVSFALAIAMRPHRDQHIVPPEGKIMVG